MQGRDNDNMKRPDGAPAFDCNRAQRVASKIAAK
jgi:hypothetical protein